MKSITAFVRGLGILLAIFVSFSATTKIDGMEVLLTTDLNSKQRDQYDEASVRRIMLDITLGGTYAYFNAHRDEVNPREALRRWDAVNVKYFSHLFGKDISHQCGKDISHRFGKRISHFSRS